MDSGLFTFFLPLALAIMMTGLGLELSIKDFLRLKLQPKAIFLALFTQQIVLVGIAFLLCVFLKLPPLLAVGLMLLSASPSGPSANLISYLYQGDVALNIMLTIMNTLICLFTLPFIVNLSLYYFLGDQQSITLPTDKILQVFLIILIPVGVGMLLRCMIPNLMPPLNKLMRILSALLLLLIFFYALYKEQHNLLEYFAEIGLATALFCLISLFIGYLLPYFAGIAEQQARTCAFVTGIHNASIAITIALSVLANSTIALPAGIYSLFMYFFTFLFGYVLTRRSILPSKKHHT